MASSCWNGSRIWWQRLRKDFLGLLIGFPYTIDQCGRSFSTGASVEEILLEGASLGLVNSGRLETEKGFVTPTVCEPAGGLFYDPG